MSIRLDHVTFAAPDLTKVIAFYDAALGALGLVRLDELVDEEEDDAAVEAVAWGVPGGTAVLWLVTAATATSGAHLRLAAGHAGEVDAFHRAATASGGRTHSAPRRWTPYRTGEYATTVVDPLGNQIEVVAPE